MKENGRICNVLNELTVEEFLETYSEQLQDRMAELGYYVQDGHICIDEGGDHGETKEIRLHTNTATKDGKGKRGLNSGCIPRKLFD